MHKVPLHISFPHNIADGLTDLSKQSGRPRTKLIFEARRQYLNTGGVRQQQHQLKGQAGRCLDALGLPIVKWNRNTLIPNAHSNRTYDKPTLVFPYSPNAPGRGFHFHPVVAKSVSVVLWVTYVLLCRGSYLAFYYWMTKMDDQACGRGGIGRRNGLKIRFPYGSGGSSPPVRTTPSSFNREATRPATRDVFSQVR